MDHFLFGVRLGFVLLALLAVTLGPLALVYYLASKNLFWTLVEEGSAKAVMRYKAFQRFVASKSDRDFDAQWNLVPAGTADNAHRSRGLRWVGIPFVNHVHEYELNYVSMEQVEDGGKLIHKVVPHRGTTDHVSLKDMVLYGLIDNAETKELIPVDAGLLLTLRIINPHRALFLVEDWTKATLNLVRPALRTFISQRGLKKLITEKGDVSDAASKFLHDSDVDEFLKEHYGVELVKADFDFIDPSGEHGKNIVQAATKEWETKQEAKRIRITSRAEEDRVNTVYGAVIKKGTDGLFIRTTEALEKAGAGQGNTVVFPLGMLDELIKAWTGKSRT